MNASSASQLELFASGNAAARSGGPAAPMTAEALAAELAAFREFGKDTVCLRAEAGGLATVPVFVNEFWTARQRQASNLHEISYRACFKPQLPRFFIERLTLPGDLVYDPFMGRGTTCLEAALLGRIPAGCDINPLSRVLLAPRLDPPSPAAVAARLGEIPLDAASAGELPGELLVFYHPDTLREICALRRWLLGREAAGELDAIDAWIRMVAVNRLTGHSPGFFSVYTLPPNQAVSVKSQTRINQRRQQEPPCRDTRRLIEKKSRQLLKGLDGEALARLRQAGRQALLATGPAAANAALPDASVDLAVTSPPFLDVVNYAGDNWLRCWFCGIDPGAVAVTMAKKVPAWEEAMSAVFRDLARVLRPGGRVAFEVGEVRGGSIRLEESVIRSASAVGLRPELVLINDQEFTKTSHCWGVDNRSLGTNTNRVVLLSNP